MPANMKFSLRFIRSDSAFEKSGKADDVATIKPTEGGQFTLDYLYRNAGQRLRTRQTLRGSDVFRWARNTLGLLQLDDAPFANIQLDVTGFPVQLLEVSALRMNNNRAYHAVLDALEFFLAQERADVPSLLSDSKFAAYINYQDFESTPDSFKIQATPTADQFVLTYNDADAPPVTLPLTRKATEEWARILMELLTLDGDPFESLQLCVAGFPDVVLRVADVQGSKIERYLGTAAIDRFLDTLNFFLNTVERPAETSEFIPLSTTSDLDTTSNLHLNVTRYFAQDAQTAPIEDEEEDELESEAYSTDSEDEYADMPPLVPAGRHLFFDDSGRTIDCC